MFFSPHKRSIGKLLWGAMIKKPGLAGLALVLVAFLFLLVSRTWRSRPWDKRSDAKGREAHPNESNVATYSDPQDFWKHFTESTSLKVNPPEYPLMSLMWSIIHLVIAFAWDRLADFSAGGTMPKQHKRCGPNWRLKKNRGRCLLTVEPVTARSWHEGTMQALCRHYGCGQLWRYWIQTCGHRKTSTKISMWGAKDWTSTDLVTTKCLSFSSTSAASATEV